MPVLFLFFLLPFRLSGDMRDIPLPWAAWCGRIHTVAGDEARTTANRSPDTASDVNVRHTGASDR